MHTYSQEQQSIPHTYSQEQLPSTQKPSTLTHDTYIVSTDTYNPASSIPSSHYAPMQAEGGKGGHNYQRKYKKCKQKAKNLMR
jgi:hypothetical protein